MSRLYDGQRASAEMLRRIRICLGCHHACLRAATACLEHDDSWAAAPLVGTILDCSLTCLVTADFMTRMTSLRAELCGICATACEACAERCERAAGEVPGMQDCAEACRDCAESCREAASTGRNRAEPGAGRRHRSASCEREEGHGRTNGKVEATPGTRALRRYPEAFCQGGGSRWLIPEPDQPRRRPVWHGRSERLEGAVDVHRSLLRHDLRSRQRPVGPSPRTRS